MARPRTPTRILEAKGSFVKHPERRAARAHEPRPTTSLGDPPAYFSKRQKTIWYEVCSLIPAGVAFFPDRLLVETCALLVNKQRLGKAKGVDDSHLLQCLVQLGMTPAARSKVSVVHPDLPAPGDGKAGPWAKFGVPGSARPI